RPSFTQLNPALKGRAKLRRRSAAITDGETDETRSARETLARRRSPSVSTASRSERATPHGVKTHRAAERHRAEGRGAPRPDDSGGEARAVAAVGRRCGVEGEPGLARSGARRKAGLDARRARCEGRERVA